MRSAAVTVGRASEALAAGVLPLALLATGLALIAPSTAAADRSDVLLAALVLFTALGIAPAELAAVRERAAAVTALSLVPLLVLAPVAWGISRLFDGPVRDGTIALGLAPTEVAAAGLVALAGGAAALALAAVVGSLVLAAIAGPLAVGLLADAQVDIPELLLRFGWAVLLPVAAGLAVRAAVPRIGRLAPQLAAASAITVAALVYAALSGATGATGGGAILAAAAFLIVSLALPLAVPRLRSGGGVTVALTFGLRDFAVAAALATAAFGRDAAAVAGVYGVLMLVAGAGFAALARRRLPPEHRA